MVFRSLIRLYSSSTSSWNYFRYHPDLQDYASEVRALNKETLGDPLDPEDRPEQFLPPPLNAFYYGDLSNPALRELIYCIQWSRTPTDFRIDEVNPIRCGDAPFGGSDYYVERFMKEVIRPRNTYAATVPVQLAMREFFKKVDEIHVEDLTEQMCFGEEDGQFPSIK